MRQRLLMSGQCLGSATIVDYFPKLFRGGSFPDGMQEDADESQETSGSSSSVCVRGIIRMAARIIGAGSKRRRPANQS
jgi:hypothetical protein